MLFILLLLHMCSILFALCWMFALTYWLCASVKIDLNIIAVFCTTLRIGHLNTHRRRESHVLLDDRNTSTLTCPPLQRFVNQSHLTSCTNGIDSLVLLCTLTVLSLSYNHHCGTSIIYMHNHIIHPLVII